MNRDTLRYHHQRIKKMSLKEFKDEQNILHTRAYELAEKHFNEAMFIVLTAKQQAEVNAKAKEIRELWDGIRSVTIETTEAM